MKTKIYLFTLIIALLLTNGQISYAVTGSSTNFVLDFGDTTQVASNSTSTSYDLQSHIQEVTTIASSTNFQIAPTFFVSTTTCGNGVKDAGEGCDGTDFGGLACTDYGYNTGSLTCSASCTIDISGCSNVATGGGGGGGSGYTLPSEEEEEEPLTFGEKILEYLIENIENIVDYVEEPVVPTPTLIPTPPLILAPVISEAEEKPIISTPTPTLSPEDLHESAEPEVKETIDQTPIVSEKLEQNKEYKVIVLDPEGNIIETENIITDEDGEFVYELKKKFESGETGKVQIVDLEDEMRVEVTYDFEIIEVNKESYEELKITSFGDKQNIEKSLGKPIDLGELEKTAEVISIEGQATPYSEIVTYFEGEELVITKTKTNSQGNFQLTIPPELKLGKRSVKIVQILPGEITADDLSYEFDLVAEKRGIDWQGCSTYLSALIFVLALILIILLTDNKKHKKKR